MVPFVLAAGPITGFYLGRWIQCRFAASGVVVVVCVMLGFLASVRESVHLVREAVEGRGEP